MHSTSSGDHDYPELLSVVEGTVIVCKDRTVSLRKDKLPETALHREVPVGQVHNLEELRGRRAVAGEDPAVRLHRNVLPVVATQGYDAMVMVRDMEALPIVEWPSAVRPQRAVRVGPEVVPSNGLDRHMTGPLVGHVDDLEVLPIVASEAVADHEAAWLRSDKLAVDRLERDGTVCPGLDLEVGIMYQGRRSREHGAGHVSCKEKAVEGLECQIALAQLSDLELLPVVGPDPVREHATAGLGDDVLAVGAFEDDLRWERLDWGGWCGRGHLRLGLHCGAVCQQGAPSH
mmetsp:Transcript_30557/g.94972  ORF Transcript_30557/g.94972 Transcript_30557/m.94972 type:complete len:288 (-) Transcript_30557:329-1192(-)